MMTLKRGVSVLCALAATGVAFAQPANDDCAGAVQIEHGALPFLSEVADITLAAPLAEFGACHPVGYTVWFKIRPPVDGQLFVSLCPDRAPGVTMFDTMLQVYSSDDGTCGLLNPVACVDDLCDFRSSVAFDAAADTTYYIQAGQYGTDVPLPGEEMVQVYVAIPDPPPADRWVEQNDAGELVGSAQAAIGSGGLGSIQGMAAPDDVDLFRIEICDPMTFSASARGGTEFDTQMFLFDAQGLGVAHNDDSGDTFQSTVTGQFVAAPGEYLLAVCAYNRDPVNSLDELLWANTPFNTERSPDGPGRLSSLHHWVGAANDEGAYLIQLTGAAFIGGCGGGCPVCAADFNQDGGVDGSDVESFFVAWEAGGECGDVNQDGGVDGGDVESFFIVWENGGC